MSSILQIKILQNHVLISLTNFLQYKKVLLLLSTFKVRLKFSLVQVFRFIHSFNSELPTILLFIYLCYLCLYLFMFYLLVLSSICDRFHPITSFIKLAPSFPTFSFLCLFLGLKNISYCPVSLIKPEAELIHC